MRHLFLAVLLVGGIALPAARATFISDTFTDTADTGLTSHTPDVGAGWLVQGGYGSSNLEITDHNDLRQDDASAGLETIFYNSTTPPTAEYNVELDILYHSGTLANNYIIRACGRVRDDEQTFVCAGYSGWHNSGGGGWQLNEQVAGSYTLLDSVNTTLSTGTYHIRLEITDASKKLFVNDVLTLQSTANGATAAGFAGIYTYFDTEPEGFHADNFSASDIETGGGPPAQPCRFLLLGAGCD